MASNRTTEAGRLRDLPEVHLFRGEGHLPGVHPIMEVLPQCTERLRLREGGVRRGMVLSHHMVGPMRLHHMTRGADSAGNDL